MPSTKVLLIGWDAADWKVINPLIENGEMPTLARFLEQGVMADMITLEPVLSPMLWNSIATGMRADKHGIHGFTEVDPKSGRIRPITSTSRKVKAIWNILSQNGYRTNVVNWFGGHPAEPIHGVCVSDAIARGFPRPGQPWPILPGTVHPAELAGQLEERRIRPEDLDEELLSLFVPRAAEIDQKKPTNRLPSLARLQAECFTVHAVATYVMENHPWDFMAIYYPSIDHFSHGFMHFHPPKPDWVEQEQFDFYSDVVNCAYRFHDLMLARLLHLAGPDTAVLIASDHGFHNDHLRPRRIPAVHAGPAVQHRPLGIFCMKGPGIKADERIYGVNLLDVAPTILTLFGLPAGQDMEGRVLAEAFDVLPSLERVPSWESVPGDSGMHTTGFEMPPEEAHLLMEQFIALGYVEEPTEDLEKARADCVREQRWNLARVYTSSWRFHEALPILEELSAGMPERSDIALALAECQQRLGLLDEAFATVNGAIENHRDTARAQFVFGGVEFDRGHYAESLNHLRKAEEAEPRMPGLHVRIGFAYLKQRRWSDAARAFQKALEIDPHNAHAWQGLALAFLRQARWEEAADAALTSVGFQHDLALSHYWLGIALMKLGKPERAIQAFETMLSLNPPIRAAHRWLAIVHSSLPGHEAKTNAHQLAARDALRARRANLSLLETIQQEARHRAIERAEVRTTEVVAVQAVGEPPAKAEEASRRAFIVVSGLPRSGTSLMMQMLEAAGLRVMTDGERVADADNPQGYFEWEAIKKLRRKPEILREAEGKVIKVISMLLPSLPRRHRYKVIFMDRPIEEVAASQHKMIKNRERNLPGSDPANAMPMLQRHRDQILAGLQAAPGFEVLVVSYPGLISDPDPWISKVTDFLGPELAYFRDAMRRVIRPELHRNRTAVVRPDYGALAINSKLLDRSRTRGTRTSP